MHKGVNPDATVRLGDDMIRVDKGKSYTVRFAHFLDDEDTVEVTVQGRAFYRTRNFFRNLGYQVEDIEEAKYDTPSNVTGQ